MWIQIRVGSRYPLDLCVHIYIYVYIYIYIHVYSYSIYDMYKHVQRYRYNGWLWDGLRLRLDAHRNRPLMCVRASFLCQSLGVWAGPSHKAVI